MAPFLLHPPLVMGAGPLSEEDLELLPRRGSSTGEVLGAHWVAGWRGPRSSEHSPVDKGQQQRLSCTPFLLTTLSGSLVTCTLHPFPDSDQEWAFAGQPHSTWEVWLKATSLGELLPTPGNCSGPPATEALPKVPAGVGFAAPRGPWRAGGPQGHLGCHLGHGWHQGRTRPGPRWLLATPGGPTYWVFQAL